MATRAVQRRPIPPTPKGSPTGSTRRRARGMSTTPFDRFTITECTHVWVPIEKRDMCTFKKEGTAPRNRRAACGNCKECPLSWENLRSGASTK